MLGVTEVFLTKIAAEKARKSAFFFSRFNFTRMKERGDTHYCFHCGGQHGFKEGEHDKEHDDAIIGNVDKYQDYWDWLEAEIPNKGAKFPYVVSVPSIW
jgi:hypothetical protein